MRNRKNQPQKRNKIKISGKKARKNKINLVFDEEKRKEFLGGFHKRKLQRRKKAQEELQQQLKEEKKRIKKNARENYKRWVSYRAVPELEELLSQNEYEEEGHTVSILELKVSDLDKQSSLIGEKEVEYEDENDNEKQKSDSEHSTDSDDEVPGMELKRKPVKKPKIEKPPAEEKSLQTGKNIKKAIKRKATKEVQKSKAFQQKQKLEHLKDKKKMRHKLKIKEKLKKKSTRGRKKV